MDILQLKSQGDEVKLLQEHLNQLGYKILIDGVFGINTANAVMQFQKDNHLTVDGIVGELTNDKITASLTSPAGLKGIDISHLNGEVNWKALSLDVSFVFCKASQGSSFKDPKFQGYFEALKSEEIIRGAYHFLTFQNATAQDQIDNFLGCNIDFSLSGILPPVLDVEWQVPNTLNAYIMDNRTLCIQIMRDWLEGISAKTNRVPIIYTNRVFWNDYLGNPSGFNKYPLWIAAYQSSKPLLPPGWSDYTFWQNSGNGTINSVSGEVDKDFFNGSLDDLKKLSAPTI